MATEVVMPQMGESIAEGTITKWLKNVGEHVDRDEPLFEISTDKVDAEIPSPAAGTLTEVRYKEGETVEVNTVVAVLDGNGAAAPPAQEDAAPAREEVAAAPVTTPETSAPESAAPDGRALLRSKKRRRRRCRGCCDQPWHRRCILTDPGAPGGTSRRHRRRRGRRGSRRRSARPVCPRSNELPHRPVGSAPRRRAWPG